MSRSKIRIAQCVNTLDAGGATDYSIVLAAELDPERFETYIIAGPGDGWLERAQASCHEVFRLDELRPTHIESESGSVLSDVRATRTLAGWLKDRSIDVLHCHSSKARVVGVAAGRMANTAAVVQSAHGFAFQSASSKRAKAARFALEFGVGRIADALIVENQSDLQRAKNLALAPEGHLHLIRTGIERNELLMTKNEAKAKLGLENVSQVVLFVGRIGEQKNPRGLVEVSRMLTAQRDAAVAIVGSGPLEVEAHALAQGAPGVRFFGERDDLAPFFAAADVFFIPSRWEGIPISVLRALDHGIPVVCSDVGGMPEVVIDGLTGFVNNCDDNDAMLRSLRRILDDEALRSRMGQNGSSLVRTSYDRASMLANHEQLYVELLAGTR